MKKLLSYEKICEIKINPELKKFINSVQEVCDTEINKPAPEFKYTDYRIFFETGDRYQYENAYFARRHRLNSFALMYILYGGDIYKKALENCIWNICDEFTWCLPAHIQTDRPFEDWQYTIDLFAAETGSALSEILSMTGDTLDPLVVQRAKNELRCRIINSYLEQKYENFWESCNSNWAAVCAGAVGITLFYEATENEINTALPRILSTMDCFLGGFLDDGCCLEGFSYWKYGFGFFVYFADMLKKYTNGEKNLFLLDKVHNIARFQQNILIGKSRSISFADGSSSFSAFPGLSFYLHSIYDDITVPPKELFTLTDGAARWLSFIRNFAWYDTYNMPVSSAREYVLYENAQWYIRNTDKFSFAAKGGHNDEQHNHNDLGSFIFISNDKNILDDYGAGEYTKQYFSPLRYTFLVTSSRGHSVPIINNNYQSNGKQYVAKIIHANKDVFEINLNKAYNIDGLSFTRRFDMLPDGIRLTDKINANDLNITERFFTCLPPRLTDNAVVIENCKLIYDSSKYDVTITEEQISSHKTTPTEVYLIDFNLKKPTERYEFSIKVEV